MNIFIGGAWPYANGSLHIGHIAGLIPGDILARYFRLKGDNVLYVSGSDCHGTPISIRAKKENKRPDELSDRYHEEFKICFEKLGFSYDIYNKTSDPFHKRTVQTIFKKLLEKGHLYQKTERHIFCTHCKQFLPDRYVLGICPHCKNESRGDQCDNCCSILNPQDLTGKKCSICSNTPVERDTSHFYISLSKFQGCLEKYSNSSGNWRENAVNLTRRYLDEGLLDRAITRDLDYGVEVPLDGFESKRIYVWIDAVCGYLSASIKWAEKNDSDWKPFWSDESVSYYVHGKDNIPFHTLILPAILFGIGSLKLPDHIVSSEYLTLEGRKVSTSKNWAIWIPYLIEHYDPDSIRYFLIANSPEKRDGNFSWREFINSHNGELLGAFGNFVNRTLAFVEKSFDSKVPDGQMDADIKSSILNLYETSGKLIESSNFKEALESIFSFIRKCNKYFDANEPWINVKSDPNSCHNTIYTSVQAICNLSNLLSPFVPFSCDKISHLLDLPEQNWTFIERKDLFLKHDVEILFQRIEKSLIKTEIEKLEKSLIK